MNPNRQQGETFDEFRMRIIEMCKKQCEEGKFKMPANIEKRIVKMWKQGIPNV